MAKRSFVGALVVSLLIGSGGVAQAHVYGDIYEGHWSQALRGSVNIYPDSTISGSFKDRVTEGAGRWDLVGTTLNFTSQAQNNFLKSCSAGSNQNMVFQGTIDGSGGTLAQTTRCFDISSGEMNNYFIEFDSAESWFLGGAGSSPGASEQDLFSVATHEFGHAGGWKIHFSDPTLCPTAPPSVVTSSRQTMCAATLTGTSYARTLSTHDIHTFDGLY